MKRIISFLLVFALVLSLSIYAFADKAEDTNKKEKKEKITDPDKIVQILDDSVEKLDSIYTDIKDVVPLFTKHWKYADQMLMFFDREYFKQTNLAKFPTSISTYYEYFDADDTDFIRNPGLLSSYKNELSNYQKEVIKYLDATDYAKETLEEVLKNIKLIKADDDTEDYYDAVKEYYKAVNTLVSFATTFPEGYSKLTYAQAIKDYYKDIDEAKSEVDFAS